jgi:hypothetical protein
MAKKDFMSLMKEKTVDVKPSLLSSEEHIKQQLVVLPQLRDLIPPLSADELAQLEQNVLKHGVKDPLTIWETTTSLSGIGSDDGPAYVLIDGHNRHSLISKHRLDFRINLVHFDSLNEVQAYMIDYQLGRRNLTPEQASYLRGMRYNQQKGLRGSNLRAEGPPQANVANALATEYGVSSRTIKRDGEFAASLEQLAPDTRRDVLRGKLSKSSVQRLLEQQAEPTSMLPNIPAIEAVAASGNVPTAKITKRVANLESRLRKLTTDTLTPQACQEIIAKTTELLSLLTAK